MLYSFIFYDATDAEPLCKINVTGAIAEFDTVEASCEVDFHSSWAPSLRCSIRDVAIGSPGDVGLLAIVVATRPMNGSAIRCTLLFVEPAARAGRTSSDVSSAGVAAFNWTSAPLQIVSGKNNTPC